ncbi:MAG: hypothetical protein HY303_13605 [Candidatus Wallbacteria bacterium]|nr:hypothetical protein [Candidatus Wallbacteria bacterium]
MQAKTRRAGFGILFGVIVLFLIVMMTMGFAQFVFGNRVASDTQSGIVGMIAVSIGQSAFEEVWRDIALQANTKGSQLFGQLRKDITDPRQALFEAKMPIDETLREIESTENWGGFQIKDKAVKMEVLGAGTLAGLTYETMGTIKLSVTVKHKPTGVSRTLYATRGYKTGLLSTPRPFDQATLFVMNPQLMLDTQGAAGANQKIRESLQVLTQLHKELRPKMIQEIRRVADKANKALGEAQTAGTEEAKGQTGINPFRFIRHLRKVRFPHERGRGPGPDRGAETGPRPEPDSEPGNDRERGPGRGRWHDRGPDLRYSDDVSVERHYFPEEPGDYVVFLLDPEVPDLSRFYLVPRIEAKNTEIEAARLQYNTDASQVMSILAEIEQAVDAGNESYKSKREQMEERLEQACKQTQNSMQQLIQKLDDRLEIYKEFTDAFSERAKAGAKELQNFSSKFNVTASQRPRAFYSFSGPDFSKSLRTLLDRYDKDGKPLNAVVHVDTGGQVLALDNIKIRGKLVLVVNGKVRLSNVSLSDPAQDLLTVHCDGRVILDGRVTASVVASSDVDMPAGTVLQGNLVMYRSDGAQLLKGKIVRDERYRSSMGGTPQEQLQGHVVVALSPRTASMIVERN